MTYFGIAPDAVFEVRSPSDRWSDVLAKVAEYIAVRRSGCVRARSETARPLLLPDRPRDSAISDEFVGIGPLAGFRVPVAKFFE